MSIMSKNMRVITRDQDENIPNGMAAIYMDNHGWVGTDNGNPLTGSPALFPEAEARALMYAWGFLMSKGVKVFPANTPREKYIDFPGLVLFDAFPESQEVIDWMDPAKQCL